MFSCVAYREYQGQLGAGRKIAPSIMQGRVNKAAAAHAHLLPNARYVLRFVQYRGYIYARRATKSRYHCTTTARCEDAAPLPRPTGRLPWHSDNSRRPFVQTLPAPSDLQH